MGNRVGIYARTDEGSPATAEGCGGGLERSLVITRCNKASQ